MLFCLKLLKEQSKWKAYDLCRAIPVSFSNYSVWIIGARAKFTVFQSCYTEGGPSYLCWKRDSVKLIYPGLLVLALVSETMPFMISIDDEKGLKSKGS